MFDHADFKGIENMPTCCRASAVFNVCTNSIFQNCLNLAAILLGRWLGDKLMRGLQIEVSWISGLMLLVLAGLKLV